MKYFDTKKSPIYKKDSTKEKEDAKATKEAAGKEAARIGKPWYTLQGAKKKITELIKSPFPSGNELIEIKERDEFKNNAQLYLTKKSIGQEIFLKETFSQENTPFLKEKEKDDKEKKKFGDAKKLHFGFSEKKGFYASIQFDEQSYNGALSSINTTRLYDYLDRMESEKKIQYKRNNDNGYVIVRINLSEIYKDSLESMKKDKKDYTKNLSKENNTMSDLLIKKSNASVNYILDQTEKVKKNATGTDKEKETKIKDVQDYIKNSLLKKSIKNGSLDNQIKIQLINKVAESLKNEFEKIGSELSKVSGGDFKEIFKEKLESFQKDQSKVSNDSFYALAASKVTDKEMQNYKNDLLNNLDKSISKNQFHGKISENEISNVHKKIMNERGAMLDNKYNQIKEKYGEEVIKKATDQNYRIQEKNEQILPNSNNLNNKISGSNRGR